MLQEKLPVPILAAAPSQVIKETPDSASDTVPETVTAAFEKPVPSTGEVTVRIGIVLSILRVTLALAVSPLASVAVPLMT